jgi:hypothetical protein
MPNLVSHSQRVECLPHVVSLVVLEEAASLEAIEDFLGDVHLGLSAGGLLVLHGVALDDATKAFGAFVLDADLVLLLMPKRTAISDKG